MQTCLDLFTLFISIYRSLFIEVHSYSCIYTHDIFVYLDLSIIDNLSKIIDFQLHLSIFVYQFCHLLMYFPYLFVYSFIYLFTDSCILNFVHVYCL